MTEKLREAARQALEACEQRLPLVGQSKIIDELNALRAALAEPEPVQEPVQKPDVPESSFGNITPVGWFEPPNGAFRANPQFRIRFPSQLLSWQIPLYTHPPKAEPKPVQEPVAWMVYTADGKSVCVTDHPADFVQWRSLPLYTAPPQRPPLTDEEIKVMWDSHRAALPRYLCFARAVERAVRGEKE